MTHLPEPRHFAGGSVTDELVASTIAAVGADPLALPGRLAALRQSIESCLAQDDECRLMGAMRAMPDARSSRMFWEAVGQTIDTPDASAGGVLTRSFALPIVILAAGTRPARVSGRLGDVAAFQALFERCNALGPTRNFGLSNALCALDAVEKLSPLAIYRSVRTLVPGEIGEMLPPADIDVKMGQEQTHLRFLVGAGVTPVEAPGFAETAANIATWGRDCAKLLAEQLRAPGVQLLALPRPPKNLLMAAHSGRCAQLEAAFNMFASNAVRKLRMAVGDPVAILTAHDSADIRITLSSPFAQDLVEGFHWPLHPLDDIAAIECMVADLFVAMKVNDVRVLDRVLPTERIAGVPLYPRADEWDALCASVRH